MFMEQYGLNTLDCLSSNCKLQYSKLFPFCKKMAQKDKKKCCNYKDFPPMTVFCKISIGGLLSCLLYNLIDTTFLETQWNFDRGRELLTWSLPFENSRKYPGSKIEMLMLTLSFWQNSLLYLAFVVLGSSNKKANIIHQLCHGQIE